MHVIVPRIVAGVTLACYIFACIGIILVPVADMYSSQDDNYGWKLALAISSLVLYMMIACFGTVWLAIQRGYHCCEAIDHNECRMNCQLSPETKEMIYGIPTGLLVVHVIWAGIILDAVHYYQSFDLVLIYGTVLDVLVVLIAGLAFLIFMGWFVLQLCYEMARVCRFLYCSSPDPPASDRASSSRSNPPYEPDSIV